MADKDKTKYAKPKPGGKPGAVNEPAENGAPHLDRPQQDGPKTDAPTTDPARAEPTRPDPTRYGDWEINGRCVDF